MSLHTAETLWSPKWSLGTVVTLWSLNEPIYFGLAPWWEVNSALDALKLASDEAGPAARCH